jgi:hypothetical protein
MCYNCGEKDKLIHTINSLWAVDRQRWALIKNKSGRLEVIPEKSLAKLPKENLIIYQLNT